MTPLLQALKAAALVGFDAPRCKFCTGYGVDPKTGHDPYPCSACEGTGLDASDTGKLIERALRHLIGNDWFVIQGPFDTTITPSPVVDGVVCDEREPERHNGTPAGLATALLRLVARVTP